MTTQNDLVSRKAIWDLVGDLAITVRPGSKLANVIHRYAYAIDHAPAVDAVEVVRCKDCKHAHMTYGGECKYCDVISMLDDEGDSVDMYLPGDWYCAAGERREE